MDDCTLRSAMMLPSVPSTLQLRAPPRSVDANAKKGKLTMRHLTKTHQKITWLVLIGATVALTALYEASKVEATPADKFTGTTLGVGKFDRINVFNHTIVEGADPNSKSWLSLQKTQGPSDLYVESNVWQPGGSTGWHTHPGHSLIMVTAGTIKAYEGDDPTCTPTEYTVGMGFVDPGDG